MEFLIPTAVSLVFVLFLLLMGRVDVAFCRRRYFVLVFGVKVAFEGALEGLASGWLVERECYPIVVYLKVKCKLQRPIVELTNAGQKRHPL